MSTRQAAAADHRSITDAERRRSTDRLDAPSVAVPALAGLLALLIEPATAGRLGCAAGPARLARAWPRRDGSVAVELRDARGAVVAGQWRADRDDLRRIARQTTTAGPGGCAVVTAAEDHRFLLQVRADRRLPGLAVALADSAAVLVGHRAEQRAVVRAGASHTKVMLPQRAVAAAVAARRAAALARAAGDPFAVAVPSTVDRTAGLLHLPSLPGTSLPGTSLAGRMASGGLRAATQAAGRATAALHAADAPAAASLHGAAQEVAVLERWLGLLAPHAPGLADRVRTHTPVVARGLLDVALAPAGPLHRDLHDGQILVDDHGAVGLLDLDTLATGEPALDVANLLVHLELATLGGRCAPDRASAAAAAFLDGYGDPPPPPDRLAAYADATRLRLVCVHAFRPTPAGLLDALLTRLGAPPPGVG